MEDWVIIAIVTGVIGLIGSMIAALFAAMVGVAIAVGTWFVNRLINGFDEKIAALLEKVITNSTKHFEKDEDQGNRITELEAYVKILLKLLK